MADLLYQHGMCLTLVHDFGGTCKVTVRISVVLRGATNDFDPGGIPFSLNFYPQIGYTWDSAGSGRRRVKQFRGSVRITVNNQTPAMGSHPALAENVANFWADSNISQNPGETRESIMAEGQILSLTLPASIVHALPQPFGWGEVFDYNRMNIQEEQEYDAVYGPADDPALYYYSREKLYYWPQAGATKVSNYKVRKDPRQGCYDNIHLHGRLHPRDGPPFGLGYGNEQIHAPFCGHSCLHMHWRWSQASGDTAPSNRAWYFKGWSVQGDRIEAFTEGGSPLIPPNQKLTVAICDPGRTRTSASKILPAAGSRAPLPALEKMIWSCADIVDGYTAARCNAGEQQVIMEHGVGWAYRYATYIESGNVGKLAVLFPLMPLPTNDSMMAFFEKEVYPVFRYWTARGITTNQIPEGTHDDVMAGARQTMEGL